MKDELRLRAAGCRLREIASPDS